MEEKVSNHLNKIRNFNLELNLDLSLITLNGFEIVKQVKIEYIKIIK